MKKLVLFLSAALIAFGAQAQNPNLFQAEIDVNYIVDTVMVPASPLKYQILFVGGVDQVQTTATYGNAAGTATAKEWNDFIGFTPDQTGSSYGWISVNHEMVIADDKVGDGGGMTVFRVERDADTDTLRLVYQTLEDGREGYFFNVDFVNHTGETGMNCGGISSVVDGRIWTAEEWERYSNADLADRDTSDFIIGQGTVAGQAAPAGFPGFNGQQVQKYQNYNYMTEIDPRQARAIRKQYNWGRQPFEGGAILSDNQTVFLGVDDTPGYFTKFVADVPGDFTSGTTYVYKHDAADPWLEIDNSDLAKMLAFKSEATALGATMYNRLEWIAYDKNTGMIYITETGRDNPSSAWIDEAAEGAVYAPHHTARAAEQGTTPDNAAYWDYYGRVLQFNPTTNEMSVLLEGGPFLTGNPTLSNYPSIHLSNPDGLNVMNLEDESFLLICEDLNGSSFGRMPAGSTNRTCELFMLDLSIQNPTTEDLVRISVVPLGAEVTGAIATPDGKTILVNSQHPSTANPFPYNHSLTYAITGWDELLKTTSSLQPVFGADDQFAIYPNPASRYVQFDRVQDVALYDAAGKRIRVYRNVTEISVFDLAAGIYFIQNAEGVTKKLIVQQ